MIESDPIPAGENNYIKICLIEDDYRIRVADLFGTILFELDGPGVNKFSFEFNQKLLTRQKLLLLDKQKKDILQAALTNELSSVTDPSDNKVTVRTSDTLVAEIKETIPNQISRAPLELIPIFPPLTPQDLDLCIKALKEKQKVSPKVTIDNDDNLEEIVLQVFDGERKTINKIVNRCAESSISILKESLKRTLERLVQEGKITSSREKSQDGSYEYDLYSINYTQVAKKNSFDILLDKLDPEFTTESYLKVAKQHNIREEVALQMLEQSSAKGEILKPTQHIFRKID